MGFWTRHETELTIGLASSAARTATVTTNWPFYVTRFERCEGFSKASEFAPADGGREIAGTLDLSACNYLWLRRHLGSQAGEDRFEAERAKLDEPVVTQTQFRPDAGERETLISANAADPYWLHIETDMGLWLRRLERHPYAVLVAEQRYIDPGSSRPYGRQYKLPRSLLTIRRARPRARQLSEAERQVLRDRLAAIRAGRA